MTAHAPPTIAPAQTSDASDARIAPASAIHHAAMQAADAGDSEGSGGAGGSGPVMPAVQLAGLSHRYAKADRDAVDHLDLTIRPGEIFALLGPNGGGKTTTFRILATLLHPSASAQDPSVNGGAVRLFGSDVLRDPAAARRHLGVVFQSPSLDIKLTAGENLLCQSQLYGLSRREAALRIDALLAQFALTDRRHDRVEAFSGGMRRKLEIAKALLHRPRLLLMDEPSTGLDPAARRELWTHLRGLRDTLGITIVFTTHLMDEAEHADRVAVLAQGRILTDDTPANLKASLGGQVVTIEPRDAADLEPLREAVAAQLGPWEDGWQPVVADHAVRFQHNDGAAVLPRVAELWPGRLQRLSVGQPTLEDAYLRLTSQVGG